MVVLDGAGFVLPAEVKAVGSVVGDARGGWGAVPCLPCFLGAVSLDDAGLVQLSEKERWAASLITPEACACRLSWLSCSGGGVVPADAGYVRTAVAKQVLDGIEWMHLTESELGASEKLTRQSHPHVEG